MRAVFSLSFVLAISVGFQPLFAQEKELTKTDETETAVKAGKAKPLSATERLQLEKELKKHKARSIRMIQDKDAFMKKNLANMFGRFGESCAERFTAAEQAYLDHLGRIDINRLRNPWKLGPAVFKEMEAIEKKLLAALLDAFYPCVPEAVRDKGTMMTMVLFEEYKLLLHWIVYNKRRIAEIDDALKKGK